VRRLPLAARTPAIAIATIAAVAVVAGLALFPTATLLAGVVTGVLVLAAVEPSIAFVVALVLFCFEGTIKVRLSIEGVPSALPVAAAALDLMLGAAVAGMLARRRAAPLLALWRDARRAERLGASLLGAWLVLSVLQLMLAGHLVTAAEGWRLSQAYVAAGVLGGALWWGSADGPRRLPLLCAGLGVAAAYAVVRIAIGPSGSEKTFALFGSDATSSFGSSFRAVGSFSGAFGLASMLAPAIVLLFASAVTRRDGRWAYAAGCVLAVVAVVGSQVRTGLVAAAVGIGFVALALLAERGLRSRRAVKLVVALGVLVALAGTAVAISSGGSSQVSRRATGLVSPLSDQSVKIRLDTWRRTLDAAVHEPLGSGLGTVGRATGRTGATYTDNSYLKALREQGFAGIALLLGAIVLLLGSLTAKLVRAGPSARPFALAALAALVTFLVMMVTGEYIEQPGKVLAWSLLGAALADLHVRRRPAAGAL
jgi:hypothetical protein